MQVDVYKPATSKANNSETYITCCGFRGIQKQGEGNMLHKLLSFVGEDTFDSTAFLPRASMPESFLQSVIQCGEWFAMRTKDALEDAYIPRAHAIEAEVLADSLKECCKLWMQAFAVKLLSHELRLSPVRPHPSFHIVRSAV
jgi:hypothetical protein